MHFQESAITNSQASSIKQLDSQSGGLSSIPTMSLRPVQCELGHMQVDVTGIVELWRAVKLNFLFLKQRTNIA